MGQDVLTGSDLENATQKEQLRTIFKILDGMKSDNADRDREITEIKKNITEMVLDQRDQRQFFSEELAKQTGTIKEEMRKAEDRRREEAFESLKKAHQTMLDEQKDRNKLIRDTAVRTAITALLPQILFLLLGWLGTLK